MRYAFIAGNRLIFAVRAVHRKSAVHPSGFHAWLREPFIPRALEDQCQTVLLKQTWDDSCKVYGYRKLHDELCNKGADVSPNRTWRLARLAGVRGPDWLQKEAGLLRWQPSCCCQQYAESGVRRLCP